jgi:opacity protein-like surface antigen
MKSRTLAISFSTALMVASPGFSFAGAGDGGFFVNGNVGESKLNSNFDENLYSNDTSETGYGLNVGYRWALNPSVALGIEGGYVNLGSFDPNVTFDNPDLRRAELSGWSIGANGHFNITPNWYVSARGGWFRGDVKGSYVIDLQTPQVDVDATSNKYYAGAGFGYDFGDHASVGVNYDYYKADKDALNFSPHLISVSAEYRF